uniref:B cell scaffold protein with ankyrin repeats 1 n=1 Tax=Scleropages formosus TaxID=113540 RepID=A0A8C9QZF0_SCLFO
MSATVEDLLIIYEEEAKQWASYLKSIFAGLLPTAGILCYDISTVTSNLDESLNLGHYRCKLLVLSQGMLEGLCQIQRFFLARVLQPSAQVVVLLCGVETIDPLLQTVPAIEGCLQLSSEQDAQVYLSTVTEIMQKGSQAVIPAERKQPARAPVTKLPMQVVPFRVPCESPGNVYVLLRDVLPVQDTTVEFHCDQKRVEVTPVVWNKHVLEVKAPDLPAGTVDVTLRFGDVAMGPKGKLQYYSTMNEVALLLRKAADPIEFMHQAFQTSSAERLDQILASALIERMPAGGFQALQGEGGHGAEKHPKDIPTLLHFAAENGLRDLTGALLQCPGAQRALHVANRHGATPLKLAKSHGHAHVYSLLQEALVGSSMGEDNTIYEMMGSPGQGNTNNSPGEEENNDVKDEDDEDPYTAVGGDDEEYDTILASNKAATITNRPPAPTPRPEATPTKKDDIPFIAQVFQKKMSQGAADNLYSQSSRQGRGQKSIGSAYDTFVPYQPPGLEELIELQEKVKKGTLTMDEALERFSDWQQVQKGLDDIQQMWMLQNVEEEPILQRADSTANHLKGSNLISYGRLTSSECYVSLQIFPWLNSNTSVLL